MQSACTSQSLSNGSEHSFSAKVCVEDILSAVAQMDGVTVMCMCMGKMIGFVCLFLWVQIWLVLRIYMSMLQSIKQPKIRHVIIKLDDSQ